jgi:hypothetical protein
MLSLRYQMVSEDSVTPVGMSFVHTLDEPVTTRELGVDHVRTLLASLLHYDVDIHAYLADRNSWKLASSACTHIPVVAMQHSAEVSVMFSRRAFVQQARPIVPTHVVQSAKPIPLPPPPILARVNDADDMALDHSSSSVDASAKQIRTMSPLHLDEFEQQHGVTAYLKHTLLGMCELLHWAPVRASIACLQQRMKHLGYECVGDVITAKQTSPYEALASSLPSLPTSSSSSSSSSSSPRSGAPTKDKAFCARSIGALRAYVYKQGKDVFDHMTYRKVCDRLHWEYSASTASMIGKCMRTMQRTIMEVKDDEGHVEKMIVPTLASHTLYSSSTASTSATAAVESHESASEDEENDEGDVEDDDGGVETTSSVELLSVRERFKSKLTEQVKKHGEAFLYGKTSRELAVELGFTPCRPVYSVVFKFLKATGLRRACPVGTQHNSRSYKILPRDAKPAAVAAAAAADQPLAAAESVASSPAFRKYVDAHGLEGFAGKTPLEAVQVIGWFPSTLTVQLLIQLLNERGGFIEAATNRFVFKQFAAAAPPSLKRQRRGGDAVDGEDDDEETDTETPEAKRGRT